MHVGSLGDVVFETSHERMITPNSFKYSAESRYEDHQVQGAFEKSEYLAPSLGSASLSIHLRRDFLNQSPLEIANRLQDMLDSGEIVRLILCSVNYGRFTIRKIDYDWNGFLKDEAGPFSLDLNLELKEYID